VGGFSFDPGLAMGDFCCLLLFKVLRVSFLLTRVLQRVISWH